MHTTITPLLSEIINMRLYLGPYIFVNGGCFALDLLLIWVLTSLTTLPDMYIVSGTFLFTSLCLYLASRFLVFSSTTRSHAASFSLFWCVVAVKMLIALYIIQLGTTYLGLSTLLARLCSGILEAGVAFVFDYFATFNMRKAHIVTDVEKF